MIAHGFWYAKTTPFLTCLRIYKKWVSYYFWGLGIGGDAAVDTQAAVLTQLGCLCYSVASQHGGMEDCLAGDFTTLLIYSVSLFVSPSKP